MVLRQLARLEARVDRWFAARRSDKSTVIEPYLGYATPTEFIARGRVLARLQGRPLREGQGVWANLRGMFTLFATDEVAGATVRAVGREATVQSDEEGYFTLVLPREEAVGWVDIPAELAGEVVDLPVLVPRDDAVFGVISDIDDTMIYTGAWSLPRNLWTTFTGNVASRVVFEDAVRMMDRLSDGGRNPIFYLSSSPWNLHRFLDEVLGRAGLVRGPRFLRDLGLNETEVLGGSHHSHKGSMIDLIFAANPALNFVLIGDTGQKDGSVYLEAAHRHPGRVREVILRRAGGPAKTADVEGLEALGISVQVVADYDELQVSAQDGVRQA